MVQRKHLVALATAIGLLISATPSHATLILQSIAASVQVGAGMMDFPSTLIDDAPAPEKEFEFVHLPGTYQANFDFVTDGHVRLILRYFRDATGTLGPAIWDFTQFDWGMTGRIAGVDPAGGNPGGTPPPMVSPDGQALRIVLPPLTPFEGDTTWDFTIRAMAAPGAAPAPGTILLVGVGVLGLARARRRS